MYLDVLMQSGLWGITLIGFHEWSFLHVFSFLLMSAVQLDSKKQIRQTIFMLLKHSATETSRSFGMSLIITNETSLGWYFLVFFGFMRGEME